MDLIGDRKMNFTLRQQLITMALKKYHAGHCSTQEGCFCDIAEKVYDNTLEEQLKFIINGDK